MKIYKFRSLSALKDEHGNCARNFTIDLLTTNKLWCPRPDTLNDLIEIRPQIDATFDEDALESYLKWSKEQCGWTIEKCSEMKSRYFVALKHGINDDYSSFIAEMINDIRTIGICSFAMNWHTPMIWGTYADNGSGIAVEFDIPEN